MDILKTVIWLWLWLIIFKLALLDSSPSDRAIRTIRAIRAQPTPTLRGACAAHLHHDVRPHPRHSALHITSKSNFSRTLTILVGCVLNNSPTRHIQALHILSNSNLSRTLTILGRL